VVVQVLWAACWVGMLLAFPSLVVGCMRDCTALGLLVARAALVVSSVLAVSARRG